jgi:hypothetical protein
VQSSRGLDGRLAFLRNKALIAASMNCRAQDKTVVQSAIHVQPIR